MTSTQNDFGSMLIVQPVRFGGPGPVDAIRAALAWSVGLDPGQIEVTTNPSAPYRRVVVSAGMAFASDYVNSPRFQPLRDLFVRCAETGTVVMGICLGGMLATLFQGGAEVRSEGPQVGMLAVDLTSAGRKHPLFAGVPDTFLAARFFSSYAVPADAGTVLAVDQKKRPVASADGPFLSLSFHPEACVGEWLPTLPEAYRKEFDAVKNDEFRALHRRILANFMAL